MAAITPGAKEIIEKFVHTLSDTPDLFNFFIDECKRAKIYQPIPPTYKSRFEYYKKIRPQKKELPKRNIQHTLPHIKNLSINEGNLSLLMDTSHDPVSKVESALPTINEPVKAKSVKKKERVRHLKPIDIDTSMSQSRMISTRGTIRGGEVHKINDEMSNIITKDNKMFEAHFKMMCKKEGLKTYKNIITSETFCYYLSKVNK